ncbi:hypothetical protein B7P43_G06047 [Cryptotermes secundus]|uniref:Uncharacterized protein n=1 Tax=Cryptotermes secundus TaxID=105785 RepID=A0A2J7RSN7_9NEOP|nr:hypothetical protein B7P43_G06047 [Cryptotermes secundus]
MRHRLLILPAHAPLHHRPDPLSGRKDRLKKRPLLGPENFYHHHRAELAAASTLQASFPL